ncbi:MAG TPA: hypothetical protein PLK76_01990 [bacterium]|nr:hypothetical protein [bacterium]
MSFYNKNLRDGEQIILILRRNWLTYLPKIILVFILFFVPIFFMFPLLAWGQIGQIIFAFLLAIALFYLLKLLSLSYFNCLIITNDRLIDFSQSKTFERTVKETDFLNIAEVAYKIKGFIQMISKSGNLEIKLKSSSQEPSLNIKGINNPEKIQILILDLKRLAIEEQKIHDQQKGISETYQEILKKIKKDIGQEGIDRLLKSINPEETLDTDEDEEEIKIKEKDFEFLK